MNNMKIITTLVLVLLLASCSVTGPVRDGDTIEKESSLDFGTLKLFKKKDSSKDESVSQETSKASSPKDTAVQVPVAKPNTKSDTANATPISNSNEDKLYQKWLNERNSNSASYQDFKEYQDYKEWLKLKK